MMKVKDIRAEFIRKLEDKEFVGNTIEIIGATFVADEIAIFGDVNHDWNQRELAWYRSQSLNVNDIPAPIPAIWKQVASRSGFINSNYGWCIWSQENGRQYDNVLYKLRADRNSRQGQMIYTRPSMHYDWDAGGMRDFMCTAYNQFYIRDDKLVSHYVMRSNDAVFGYKGDRHWAKTVQIQLAQDLGVECGALIWTASSLHVYDRHFHLVK
jgi:thymidylate synthase